ncbi:hypothetical protein EA145_05610 [Enterobacter hormaechei]|nr:hypothetical protein CU081_11535 [Enterobacter sp. CRENT-193]AVO85340.1 hypothetical protein AM472_20035 [Enterobacter cloacae complex sp.]PZA26301.1 hypothetical protein C7B73_11540 [Enterobacter hormaechei]RAZ16279.1 hypothetical protein DP201_20570 [Enterobacter hormaechei subsp. xiangfangensis]RDU14334.1 hypothetical protein DWV01_15085 [Enterobacter hormaechei]
MAVAQAPETDSGRLLTWYERRRGISKGRGSAVGVKKNVVKVAVNAACRNVHLSACAKQKGRKPAL